MRSASCLVCGTVLDGSLRVVLVRGRGHEEHCSEVCLLETVRARRVARAARQRRLFSRVLLVVLVVAGARFLWQRTRCPSPQAISFDVADFVDFEPAPRQQPIPYGPAWPPTDDEWIGAFDKASWIYPLPGPVRRPPVSDGHMLGHEAAVKQAPVCRRDPHCGVELGGDLWGEHVYAALDGVVERVQRGGSGGGGKHGDGHYVRISHLGGMVFTQYLHLAAIWHSVTRGARVRAGDVIGLLGDTGLESPDRHLHFSLSVRPSKDFAEVYWDPTPWMTRWPLRSPAHGTVAGFTPAEQHGDLPRRRGK